MVGLGNYVDGFGGADTAGQADLIKAMQAGHVTGRDTTNLGLTQEPLKVESLETALKVLDFRTQDVKLFNALPKLTAFNTVEEYLQLDSYGAERGGFYREGELSDVVDSTYVRRAEHVKYMQVTGEVTLQAQIVRSYVKAMKAEVQNKMLWILRLADKTLTKGDADVIPEEFNSLYKQHQSVGVGTGYLYADNSTYYNSGLVIDLRGKSIKQEDIEAAAVMVDMNYGQATDFFGPTTMISTLSQDFYNRQRFFMTGNASPVTDTIGTNPDYIATTQGKIRLNSDKFMAADKARLANSNATSPAAPAAPTVSAAAIVANDVQSKYVASEAGNVFYAVSALNNKGESALGIVTTAVALVAGAAVDLTISPSAGANPASGYVIYRSKVAKAGATANDVQFYPIFKVSAANVVAGYDGAAGGKVRDRGFILPDTEQGFVAEVSEDVMSFKQLAPMSKLDLAVNAMSRRFIAFLMGTPILYAPKKFVRIINAGKLLSIG